MNSRCTRLADMNEISGKAEHASRPVIRACGKVYKSVEEAEHSKAVLQSGGVIDPDCWYCHGVHVRVPKTASVPATGRPSAWSTSGPPEFTRRVKHLIRARAGSGDPFLAECESCGISLGDGGGEVVPRQEGSPSFAREVLTGPANGVLMCGHCIAKYWRRAREMRDDGQGFWIRRGTTPGFDPRNVPILLGANGGSGLSVWLDEGGRYLFEAPSPGEK
jgi:hypothetical protein